MLHVTRQFPPTVRFDKPAVVRLQVSWGRIVTLWVTLWFWLYAAVIVFALFVRALHRDE